MPRGLTYTGCSAAKVVVIFTRYRRAIHRLPIYAIIFEKVTVMLVYLTEVHRAITRSDNASW